MLRDIAQSFDATKNETMAIVESDVKLYLGFQGKTASIDDCATLYRLRIDTIKAHGGEPGYHPAQQARILDRELKAKGMDDAADAALKPDDKIVFDKEIMKLARGEYFACLFVRQTDTGRYGELKKQLSTTISAAAQTARRLSKEPSPCSRTTSPRLRKGNPRRKL